MKKELFYRAVRGGPVTRSLSALAAAAWLAILPLASAAQSPGVGVVVMHGKGGAPSQHVSGLAAALAQKGYLVENLEMPWSGRRQYDVPVDGADQQIDAAFEGMRAKGAGKFFVAGHSQGGIFALHYGATHPVDGVIAIAPGGSVASPVFRNEVGASVDQAHKLVEQGKGSEKARFADYEASKGTLSVVAPAASYLSWFDPEGAMNQAKSSKAMSPKVPVLYVAPTNDYPALGRIKQSMFAALPANPLTRMVEPVASHLEAPTAARDEVIRWITEVATRP
jgi:pimeloyl-ACP methyl ester carboxylesterase